MGRPSPGGWKEPGPEPARTPPLTRSVCSPVSLSCDGSSEGGCAFLEKREVGANVPALARQGERAWGVSGRARLAPEQPRPLHRRGQGSAGARKGNEVARGAPRACRQPDVRSEGACSGGSVPSEGSSEPSSGAAYPRLRTAERTEAHTARGAPRAAGSRILFSLVRRVEEGRGGERRGGGRGGAARCRGRSYLAPPRRMKGHGLTDPREVPGGAREDRKDVPARRSRAQLPR